MCPVQHCIGCSGAHGRQCCTVYTEVYFGASGLADDMFTAIRQPTCTLCTGMECTHVLACRQRVAFHEAGHFLIAYMTGLLPLAYTLSSLDAYMKYRTLNVQAGCRFADAEFDKEVQSGKVKSSSLERFSCVALAGTSEVGPICMLISV